MTYPNPCLSNKARPRRSGLSLIAMLATLFWAHGAFAQTQAQAEINAVLTDFAGVVNAHSAARDLDYTHMLPFFDANFRDDGFNTAAAAFADNFRGGSISSLSVNGIVSLSTDAAGNSLASTTGSVNVSFPQGPFSANWAPSLAEQDLSGLVWYYRPVGGTWKMYGNQEPAKLRVQTFTEIRSSGLSGGDGTFFFVWFDARAPQNSFTSISVTGPGYSATPLVNFGTQSEQLQASPPPAAPLVIPVDQLVLNGAAVATLPPVGTPYTFTLTPASGPPKQAVRNVQPWTTETIAITKPTGHALADANLGGSLTVNWTLPQTFTPQSVSLSMVTNSAAGSCNAFNPDNLPANATSYTFNAVPTQCLGQPFLDGASQGLPVSVLVTVTGTRGEITRAQHSFGIPGCGGTTTPPSGLQATASNLVQLRWSRACMLSTIGNYGIYRSSAASGPFSLIGTTDQNTLSYSDAKVSAGKTYYYYVVATDTRGNISPQSNQLSATTTGSSVPPPVVGDPNKQVAPPPTTQAVFAIPAGQLPQAAVSTAATGTLGNATVTVTLDLSKVLSGGSFAAQGQFASGYNIYVAAFAPSGVLGLPSATWFVYPASRAWAALGSPIAAYMEGLAQNASNTVEINILQGMDVTGLVGTEIYIGYGTSDAEMLSAGRYRGVYKVQ